MNSLLLISDTIRVCFLLHWFNLFHALLWLFCSVLINAFLFKLVNLAIISDYFCSVSYWNAFYLISAVWLVLNGIQYLFLTNFGLLIPQIVPLHVTFSQNMCISLHFWFWKPFIRWRSPLTTWPAATNTGFLSSDEQLSHMYDIILCLILMSSLELWTVTEENTIRTQMFFILWH